MADSEDPLQCPQQSGVKEYLVGPFPQPHTPITPSALHPWHPALFLGRFDVDHFPHIADNSKNISKNLCTS